MADENKNDENEKHEEDPVVEAGHEEKAKDPDTTANPSELQKGGGGEGPNVHSGGPSEL